MTEIIAIPVPDSKYREVAILDEYNGVYSIIVGKAGDKRNFWKMVYPQTRENQPGSKPIPMKVTLGDKHAAPIMLRQLADALEGRSQGQDSQFGNRDQDGAVDDQIPF
jgi:hypothetical protein